MTITKSTNVKPKQLLLISSVQELKISVRELNPDEGEWLVTVPDFDSFSKMYDSGALSTPGFIIFDIGTVSGGAPPKKAPGRKNRKVFDPSQSFLKNFHDLFKKNDIKPADMPPIICAFAEFRSKMLEELVMDPAYVNFYGIFEFGDISRANGRLLSLVRNHTFPGGPGPNAFKIGAKCRNEFQSRKELESFYMNKKFASLFIGSNRDEMLRLRAELIKNAGYFKKLFEMDLTNIFNSDTRTKFLNDYFKYLKEPGKFKETYEEYFDCDGEDSAEEGWKGYSVLILGETGVGKSLVCEWIGEFIRELCGLEKRLEVKTFNCSNLLDETFESEFYGRIKGACPGIEDAPGLALESVGKILFLDEVGALTPRCQAKLLTYLQDFKISPFGYSGKGLFVPNIVVAATNEKIEPEDMTNNADGSATKKTNEFRSDLFFRFKTRLRVLPLRERGEVLDLLIDYVLQNPFVNPLLSDIPDGDGKFDYLVDHLDDRAYSMLMEHDYTGNFRELELIVNDAVTRAVYERSRSVKPEHITLKPLQNRATGEEDQPSVQDARDREKKRKILKILEYCSKRARNKHEIASAVGLTPKYVSEMVLPDLIKSGKIRMVKENNDPRTTSYITV